MFKKATLKEAKLRLALYGPAGAGKTYTSLKIAQGMKSVLGGEIALIDTERGSASKYADRFDFYVAELQDKSVEGYIKAISLAEKEFNILIIDSISHAWQELLEYVDLITRTKYKNNSFQAWGEATPLYKSFLETLLNYNGHIIVTMRAKTEWAVEKDEGTGKIRPVRLGLAPEQRSGIEYEFDILGELNLEHTLYISKDRSGKFQDRVIIRPDEDFGVEIGKWLAGEGENKQKEDTVKVELIENDFDELLQEVYGEEWKERKQKILKYYKANSWDLLPNELKGFIIETLQKKREDKK